MKDVPSGSMLVVFWSEHVYDGPSFTCVIYSWLAVTKEQCGCSFNWLL